MTLSALTLVLVVLGVLGLCLGQDPNKKWAWLAVLLFIGAASAHFVPPESIPKLSMVVR